MTGTPFAPFENEEQVLSVGDMTVENRLDAVEIYGRLAITRDAAGLARAEALKQVLEAAVASLRALPDLPAEAEAPEPPTPGRDPWG